MFKCVLIKNKYLLAWLFDSIIGYQRFLERGRIIFGQL